MSESSDEILTLEPLLEAVRDGVESRGWVLSGLQKTTSHRFEGRWEGESSRSAYLFFHRDDLPDTVSVDVYLDETSRGLRGNLALVLEGPELHEVGDVEELLGVLGRLSGEALPQGYRTPVTLRFRLPGPETDPGDATTEYRFKLHLPRSAVETGSSAISAVASATVEAFETLLKASSLRPYLQE